MVNKNDIIKELFRVFKILDRPFSRREYNEISNISSPTVERIFGSWSKALDAAGMSEKFQKIKDVQEEAKGFNPDKAVKERWEKEKTALVDRANERQNKWLREHVHKINLLKEMMDASLSQAEPHLIEINPAKAVKISEERTPATLWFEFSDLQLGTCITSEEMGGLNKHNWTIWQVKLNSWKTQVIKKIAEYRKRYVLDHVVIACLGDMVEGQDIFAGQAWQVDKDVVDQALYGANDTAAAFIEIMATFPEIKFRVIEVFGNHGRLGKKGEAPYSCSMDKVYQRFVYQQLKACKEVKNCVWFQNESWFYLVNIYRFNHLILHGDQGVSGLWSNRPTINGLEKSVVRYNQMLQQQIHFLHVGHFHNSMALSFNMSQVLVNGSFIGTSTFSAHQMVAASPPEQILHVFEPGVGLSRSEHIYLAEDVSTPTEPHKL